MGFRALAWAVIPSLAFLILFALGDPLAIDDTHSTYHAFGGVGDVVDSLRSDSHPPLYFMFLAVWMQIGGMSEVWLRLPSILFSAAAGLSLWIYGQRVGGGRLGLMFAVFYLFNPIVVAHFHTVRPYALAGLFATLSTIGYLRLADGGDSKGASTWWAYVAANVLGTLTHYWFFFLLAGQGVGALLALRGRRVWTVLAGLAVSVVPFAVFWTPVFLEQSGGAPTSWMSRPGGWFWLTTIPVRLVGGDLTLALVVYGLAFAGFALRLGRRTGKSRGSDIGELLRDRRVWLLAAILLSVFGLAFAVSQIQPVYHLRYTIVATPAFAILLGLALEHLADRRLAALVPLSVIVGSLVIRDHGGFSYNPEQDSRAVSELLIEAYQEGDELLHVTLNYAPTLHYLRALEPDRVFAQTVFPARVARHPGWRDPEALSADSLRLRAEATELAARLATRPAPSRVWVLADFQRDSSVTRLLIEQLETDFVLQRVVPVQGWWVSEVRLYEPRPASADAGIARLPRDSTSVGRGLHRRVTRVW
jgi:hypothetical protein